MNSWALLPKNTITKDQGKSSLLHEKKLKDQLFEELRGLNMDFSVEKCVYQKRTSNLSIEAAGKVKSSKHFPVFSDKQGKEQIFKPLSKTKPLCTPFFAYAEVFWSNILHHYFDSKTPIYRLAECDWISKEVPKYYEKWTLVPNILVEGQSLVNLLEYFRTHPDPEVNIDGYINYAMASYYYVPIFKSQIFSKNQILWEGLAYQVLYSILTKNMNFHYENIAFIQEEGKIKSLAPALDHEFSLFFLFPEKNNTERMNFHNWYNTNMCTEMNVVLLNIEFIKTHYPEVVQDFIYKLKQLQLDLQGRSLKLGDWEYIRPFSSSDWQIWEARFKEYDEEHAQAREKVIKKHTIDLESFSSELHGIFLEYCSFLEHLLTYPIKALEVDA